MNKLTYELAKALGIPDTASKAVLTLEAGKPPLMELTMYNTDTNGRYIFQGIDPAKLAQVQFMIRLEPFK